MRPTEKDTLTMKMYENEIEISDTLVQNLVHKQFPDLSKRLSLKRVKSYGTDNVLYKLGDDFLVRLPKIDWATEQIEKEFDLLPKIAQYLPLKIPKPISIGLPQEQYPWNWGMYEWIEGNVV